LTFVKPMDASSADLTGAALSGMVYPRIVLIAQPQGERPFIFMRLTLTDSIFTSFKTGGNSSNESGAPIETISAKPSTVKTDIYEQDERGGRVLAATSTVTCP
jgi:type VI protein secretion system component Hcp